MLSAGLAGFVLAISLIMAIGAQNAFILRQGLKREHVFILCLICALSDTMLIAAGVAGLGTLIRQYPAALMAVSVGGAAFLFVYGLMAFRRAFNPDVLKAGAGPSLPPGKAVAACLAFTFLNPHVYLDTVILLGGLSARYEGLDRLAYALGASAGSFAWFFSLGYGARLLAPVFARPKSWQVLDILIGMVMWALAAKLATELL